MSLTLNSQHQVVPLLQTEEMLVTASTFLYHGKNTTIMFYPPGNTCTLILKDKPIATCLAYLILLLKMLVEVEKTRKILVEY
jgi:hypothetical protein